MAQTERAKCYYITIPGMIQGKISAERGKIAQNQPIRGMISAVGGAAVGFREISFPYYISWMTECCAGRIATARHGTPLPSTIGANAPRRAPFCPFGVFALRSAAQSGMMKSAEIAF